MASMREIKRRRGSIQSTQQITKAMKLVATVKLQKARQRAENSKPYFQYMYKTVTSMLAKAGNKELTTKVSDYISMCIYKVFRIMYSSNKNNTQSLFEINNNVFEGYTTAAQIKLCADINDLLKDKQLDRDCFEMTSETIAKDYPQHSTGFFNVIKSAEDVVTK